MGRPEAIWGVLERSVGDLEPSWTVLGAVLGLSWVVLGPFKRLQPLTPGGLGGTVDRVEAHRRDFWRVLTRPRRILPGTLTEWSRTAHTADGSGRIEDAGGASPAAPWSLSK